MPTETVGMSSERSQQFGGRPSPPAVLLIRREDAIPGNDAATRGGQQQAALQPEISTAGVSLQPPAVFLVSRARPHDGDTEQPSTDWSALRSQTAATAQITARPSRDTAQAVSQKKPRPLKAAASAPLDPKDAWAPKPDIPRLSPEELLILAKRREERRAANRAREQIELEKERLARVECDREAREEWVKKKAMQRAQARKSENLESAGRRLPWGHGAAHSNDSRAQPLEQGSIHLGAVKMRQSGVVYDAEAAQKRVREYAARTRETEEARAHAEGRDRRPRR